MALSGQLQKFTKPAACLTQPALSGTVFSFSGRWMLSHGNSFVTR
jgi:hypothetical protein